MYQHRFPLSLQTSCDMYNPLTVEYIDNLTFPCKSLQTCSCYMYDFKFFVYAKLIASLSLNSGLSTFLDLMIKNFVP